MNNQEKIRIDEGVYLKKDKLFGTHYRLIYPLRKDDGTLNKFNLYTGGSCWNLIKIIIFVLLMIGLILAYRNDMRSCVEINEKLYAQIQGMDFSNVEQSYYNFEPNLSEWIEENKEVEGDGVG